MFTLNLDINKVEIKDIVETILERDIVRYVKVKILTKETIEEIPLTADEFKESVECNVKEIIQDLEERGYIIKAGV
jgi:hypothetical protein